jgi:hypothetical protein
MSSTFDVRDAFVWEDDLPRPDWSMIDSRIAQAFRPDEAGEAWTAACRQWLEQLCEALRPDYSVAESPRTLVLAPDREPFGEFLLGFAAECRRTLAAVLPGIAEFGDRGKQVLVVLKDESDYYRYVEVFYPEGRSGGSTGDACPRRVPAHRRVEP